MTDKDDVWSLDDQDDYYYDSDEEDFMEELYDTDSIDGDSNKNDWTWETFQKHTHILLPPLMPSNNKIAPPSYILHFVGGTLFGSYPLQFYKRILEQIAKLTNSVVVASSIPIVFNENPLNHNKISRRISNRFWNAYRYVIVDEYGQEAVETMKIVGLGHSLGARLMMLMSNKNLSTETATRSRNRKKILTMTHASLYHSTITMRWNPFLDLHNLDRVSWKIHTPKWNGKKRPYFRENNKKDVKRVCTEIITRKGMDIMTTLGTMTTMICLAKEREEILKAIQSTTLTMMIMMMILV